MNLILKCLYFRAEICHDVWQFGIVIFVCLTGCLPWQKAALDDPRYARYLSWHSSAMPIKRQPKLFKLISSKAQKLFKKFLEPRVEKRPTNLTEVHRFLDDRWMSKVGIEKSNEAAAEDEGLCPSMYSFHSSPEEKNKLLYTLTQYGLETTVDRTAKKDRIRQWIQASVIEEEDEGEKEHESHNLTEGERLKERGPISDKRVKRQYSVSTKTNTVYTPPIDPRVPLEQQQRSRTASKPVNGTTVVKTVATQSNGTTKQFETIKHGINVQIPQTSTMFTNHQNGHSSVSTAQNSGGSSMKAFERFHAYSTSVENKSSSTNSLGDV